MKIWVIGRNYPTAKNKMCGSFEFEQAQMLAKNGHEVCYISCPFHPLYKIKNWGFAKWQEDGICVYAYSQIYFPQRLKIYLDSFKKRVWRNLLNRIEQEQGIPDVIHIHYPTLITIPSQILKYKRNGTKVVATEHWTSVLTGDITKHATRQLRKYVDGVDHFICVGEPLKQSVLKLTNTDKEISVVPNIVPNCFVKKTMKHQGIVFVAVGRLVKVKQFDKLIQVFSDTFSSGDDVFLVIIGDGNQYMKLKHMISKAGVCDRVRLLGAQSRNAVADWMAKSDALISYSRLETFGVPVIEGWYVGLPVIATTAIGFQEYWKEYLGELIPFDNDYELQKAIKKVKNGIEVGKYKPQIISQYAKDNFSEEAVYQKLIAIYRD